MDNYSDKDSEKDFEKAKIIAEDLIIYLNKKTNNIGLFLLSLEMVIAATLKNTFKEEDIDKAILGIIKDLKLLISPKDLQ